MEAVSNRIRSLLMAIMRLHPQALTEPSLMGASWISFFWSMSSLMIFSLLPAFLVDELHATNMNVGTIEGVALLVAFMAKVYAGIYSDHLRVRKPFILVGSIGSVLVKPLFAFSTTVGWVFFARFIDRFSKGVRSSPLEALIADYSTKNIQGRSFGIRQALYTLGAVIGSASAALLMHLSHNNYRVVFLCSIVPAVFGVIILLYCVKEPQIDWSQSKVKARLNFATLHQVGDLPPMFWRLLIITSILMFARFSEAFLTLRAKEVGLAVEWLPFLIVFYDLLHAGVAYPIGRMADRMDRQKLLLKGILVLFIANIVLINAETIFLAFLGSTLCGLHMGMTQGLLSTLVAESTPSHLKGTAFALFYLVCGVTVLLGNLLAGYLADSFGQHGSFYGGAFFTLGASLCLFFMIRKHKGLSYPNQTR